MSRVRITQKTNYLITQNLRHIIFMWRQLLLLPRLEIFRIYKRGFKPSEGNFMSN